MSHIEIVAEAGKYQDIPDLFFDMDRLQPMTKNYWTGEFIDLTFRQVEQIQWSRFLIIDFELAETFFGYES